MKHCYLLLLIVPLFLLTAGSSNAQWQSTGLDQLLWVRALANDNGYLFAGTWGNGIFRSSDGGATWDTVNTGLPDFYARWVEELVVAQSTGGGTITFAGFEYGGVYRSTNDGESWEQASSGIPVQTNLTALGTAGTTVLVGLAQNGENGVYRTANDGGSWAVANAGFATAADSNIRAFATSPPGGAAGSKFFAATDGGVFMSASDGAGWTSVNSGLPAVGASALGVTSGFGHTNLFTCMVYKGVYRSTDDGSSWTEADNGFADLTGLYVSDFAASPISGGTAGPNIFAATSIGVYVSTNNGANWYETGSDLYNNGVWPSKLTIMGDYLYTGGYQGHGVWKYSIAIDTGWAVQPSGTSDMLYTVKAVDNNIVWAGGTNGCVLRTTNGGAAWDSVGGGRIGTGIVFSVDALDANNALVASDSGAAASILKTTNGGSTWTKVFGGDSTVIAGIRMRTSTEGYAVGLPVAGKWTVLKTTNGGTTWARIPNEPDQNGDESVTFAFDLTGTTLTFGSTNGRIYRSTDLGTTWSSDSVSQSPVDAIHFNSPTTSLAGFYDGTVDYSTNSGVSWDTAHATGTRPVVCISGIGNEYWAIVGSSIFYSNDTGNVWKTSTPGFHGLQPLQALSFSSAGSAINGWAVGQSGIILHYRRGATGVKDNLRTIPVAFDLKQNYPNPFNPTTTIHYDLPMESRVSLKIFNVLGQEVTTLTDRIEQAGSKSARWDAANAASGVYFYRLEAASTSDPTKIFSRTGKMLLVR